MTPDSKSEMRARFRALRESISPDERASIDETIAAQAENLAEFKAADALFTYLSVGAEVDTRRLIRSAWKSGKLVAIPRCLPDSRLMQWHRIDSFDNLECSSFNIEEPPDDKATLVNVPASESEMRAVAFVPGYSFDADGYRLGYGGGFYDAFLPEFHGIAIGLCRALQFSEEPLPRDAHDMPVEIIVMESRTLRPSVT